MCRKESNRKYYNKIRVLKPIPQKFPLDVINSVKEQHNAGVSKIRIISSVGTFNINGKDKKLNYISVDRIIAI